MVKSKFRGEVVRTVNISRNTISGGAIVMVASLFLLWLFTEVFGKFFGISLSFLNPALNMLVVLVPVVFAYKFLDDTRGTGYKEFFIMALIVFLNMLIINYVAPKFIPALANPVIASFLRVA